MDLKKQDKALEKYYKEYNKQKLTLMDEIQNVVNGFDYKTLNQYNANLGQFRRETSKAIELYQLSDYQLYMARKKANKRRLKNKDILYMLILYKYAWFQTLMVGYELKTIQEVNKYFVDETLKQCKKFSDKEFEFDSDTLVKLALEEPNNLGYIWEDYRYSLTDYNADEMYNDLIVQLREEEKTLVKPIVDIDLINRQEGRLIKKKNFAGALENQIDWVTSYSQMQIYDRYGIKEVRVMGVLDEKTCKVCEQYIGRIYKYEDIVIGEQVNSHINCRCYLEAWK